MPGTTTSPATPEAGGSQVMIPIAFVTVVILMVLPIPTMLLDLFLSFNITLALIILLVGMYIVHPLQLSAFPTILLLAVSAFRIGFRILASPMDASMNLSSRAGLPRTWDS